LRREPTPFLTRSEVEELGRFRPEPYLVTSLYLDMDRSGQGSRLSATLRTLLREHKAGLQARGLTRRQLKSAEADLGALERLARDAQARAARSICVFVASGPGFERVIDLPHPVKSRLVLAETPFVRPLAVMLAGYPRYLAVLVDRTGARLFGVHLGRAVEVGSLVSDTPPEVKEGGYRGYEERSIDRRIQDHLLRHLKEVAEATRLEFEGGGYDHLVLAGAREAVARLAGLLPAWLRGAAVGEARVGPDASCEEVAAACRPVVEAHLARRDEALVAKLEDARAKGTGVTGMAAVLGAQRRGAVGAVLVVADYEEPGVQCRGCGLLAVEGTLGGGRCPACGATETKAVPDLVREVLDLAATGGAEVWHVGSAAAAERLRDLGGIGAFLRFRLV